MELAHRPRARVVEETGGAQLDNRLRWLDNSKVKRILSKLKVPAHDPDKTLTDESNLEGEPASEDRCVKPVAPDSFIHVPMKDSHPSQIESRTPDIITSSQNTINAGFLVSRANLPNSEHLEYVSAELNQSEPSAVNVTVPELFTSSDKLNVSTNSQETPKDIIIKLSFEKRLQKLPDSRFIDYEASIPEKLVDDWKNNIQIKLDRDLCRLMDSSKIQTQGVLLTTQFYMTGKKTGEFLLARPTIIISCGSKRAKRKIDKLLATQNLTYLRVFNQPCITVYEAPPAYWATSPSLDGSGRIERTNFPLDQVLVQDHPSGFICGLKMKFMLHHRHIPNFATFGGVVFLHDKPFCLTTAHSFFSRFEETTSAKIGIDVARDAHDIIETQESSSSSEEEDNSISSKATPVMKHYAPPDNMIFNSVPSQTPALDFACSFQGIVREPSGRETYGQCISDWALFRLPSDAANTNVYKDMDGSLIVLKRVADLELPIFGVVTLLIGTDCSMVGCLTRTTVSFHFANSVMTVREVRLHDNLPLGASGAWVVREDILIGYVVAVAPTRSCCYILPVKEVFAEISTNLKCPISLVELLGDISNSTQDITKADAVHQDIKLQSGPQTFFEDTVLEKLLLLIRAEVARGLSEDLQLHARVLGQMQEALLLLNATIDQNSTFQRDRQDASAVRINRSAQNSGGSLEGSSTLVDSHSSDFHSTNPLPTNRALTTVRSANIVIPGSASRDARDTNFLDSYLRRDNTARFDEPLCAQQPLGPEKYEKAGLLYHVQQYAWTLAAYTVLRDVLLERSVQSIFERSDSAFQRVVSRYTVFDVGKTGSAKILQESQLQDSSRASTLWSIVSTLNGPESSSASAVGRLISVTAPSAAVLVTLHYVLVKHVDVDEIFELLSSPNAKSLSLPPRPFSDDDRRQRTTLFSIAYHALAVDWRITCDWQNRSNDSDVIRETVRHTSVITLSFEGTPSSRIRHVSNKETASSTGYAFDPFLPWRVIWIRTFADVNDSEQQDFGHERYMNGPEAFLELLILDLETAHERLKELHLAILAAIRPKPEILFSQSMQDSLLFEDADFSHSRKHFWAQQASLLLMDDIANIATAFRDAFTNAFWVGEDGVFWPHVPENSQRIIVWEKRLEVFRLKLQSKIDCLQDLIPQVQDTMKEIGRLSDVMLKGTLILEARSSVGRTDVIIQQARHIRILLYLIALFIPALYVSSVFSMTNISKTIPLSTFGEVFIAICIPSYLVVVLLDNSRFLSWINGDH